MKRILIKIFLLSLTVTAGPIEISGQPPSEDVILQWNRVLGQTLESGAHPGTILPARSFAMLNVAMFDAINSIEGNMNPT